MVKSSAMFRRLTILLLVALPALAQGPNAGVIVYRAGRIVGSAINIAVSVDGEPLGTLRDNRYFSLTLLPGPHTFTVPKGNGVRNDVAPVTLTLAPGSETFVRLKIEGCFGTCTVSLVMATPDQQRAEFARARPEERRYVSSNERLSLDVYAAGAAAARTLASSAPAAVQPAPQVVAPPPPTTGSLVVNTQPPSAQIYLDDTFKGTSSAEGKLVVTDVKVGLHVVRLTAPGYKEMTQAVSVSPGDNPLLLTAERAGPKPLTEPEVEKALRDGIPKPRVEALVKEYGVDFALTTEIQQRLREAGASDGILLAIATNKK